MFNQTDRSTHSREVKGDVFIRDTGEMDELGIVFVDTGLKEGLYILLGADRCTQKNFVLILGDA